MKEIDDTPMPETESEDDIRRLERYIRELEERIVTLNNQVANLETQRTPQDENDDPEWY